MIINVSYICKRSMSKGSSTLSIMLRVHLPGKSECVRVGYLFSKGRERGRSQTAETNSLSLSLSLSLSENQYRYLRGGYQGWIQRGACGGGGRPNMAAERAPRDPGAEPRCGSRGIAPGSS